MVAAQVVFGLGTFTSPAGAAQLVGLSFNEGTGTTTANSGSLGGVFTRTAPTPAWTTNAPGGVGMAIDYGTTIGNFGVDSPGVLAGLGNLPRFTITGWLNCRSSTAGAGGNRIARWYVGGGHGVDLVYRNDGSLDLGVNAFSSSVARSTAGRIPTSATAAPGNWRFFAVTYDSTLAANQVRYYFGTPTTDAVLDVTRTYAAGPVGANVGSLTVGAANLPARTTSTDRMFRGLIDDVRIFDTALSPTEIVAAQGRLPFVSIAALDATASEPGLNTGTFRVSRVGSTNTPLTVNLAYSGEAANGADYTLLPATAVIPAGSASVDLVVTPIDDTVYDPEPVIATIATSATYLLGTVTTATINLLDNDPPPFFDAQEIFPPPALTLAVPPVNYTGPIVNDTRVFPTGLPVGTIASIVLPAATVVSMTPSGPGFEFVVNNGGEDFTIYTHGGTGIDAGLTVGSVVRVVSTRTVEPGPIVADVIRLRPGPAGGLDISFLYQGVVSYASSLVWIVGGVDFAIIKNGALPTDIGLNGPPVIGSTVVTVQYFPNATFPGLGPPPANYLDAAEIFPPVGLTLQVPPTLFRNPRTDLTQVPVHILPAGSVCVVVIPGGTITAINTDPVTGGREYAVSTGTETLYVYNHLGTGEDAGLAVGSVVRVVATRSLLPGPVVADVIRARPDPLDGSSFAFFYQGVVTRADAGAWTIGGVDFNIVGPSGGLPTSFAVTLPPTLGSTIVQVEYVIAPNAVVPPPALVSIAASDAAADEFGPDLGNYVVTRTIPTNLPLVVSFLLSGTASNGVDYATLSGSVTIPAGSFSVDLALTPLDDLLIEAPETAVVTVQTNEPFYFVGAPASATVTIADDDTPPTVSIAATDAVAGESGPDAGTFTFTRGAPLHRAVTVNYLIGGTAGNGTDYALLGSSVTIPAGSATATVTVTPIDDPTREPSETVTLTLLTNLAYSLGTPTNATVSISDDDAPSVVTLAATDAAAAEEGLNPGTITLTRTVPTNLPLTVVYVTAGTATHGVDYTSVTNSIVIPAAAFSVDVVVTPIDDLTREPNETVTVTLQASVSYDLGAATNATVTIADNDAPSVVTLAATDAAAAEASLDPGTITITRTVPTNAPLTVVYVTAGTATHGADYTSVTNSIVIPAAAFSADIVVTPIDDLLTEGTETVTVTLQASVSYDLGAATNAAVSIADDEVPPTVTLTVPDAAAAEALLDPGLFLVTRSLPTNLPLVVNYLITGTAANGTDYASVAASVTIPAASFTAQILVTPVDDTLVEPAETVVATLQSSVTYVLGATTNATISIADNDTPPFPQPLVQLRLNENTGTTTVNSGTLGGTFTRTAPTPVWTTNRPPTVGGVSAVDFGTTVGNFGIDSPGVMPGLGNLQRFTLTGWLNNRNTSQGSGGNRVIRNYVSGAHGIDLVYRSDGAMDLGVNEFPGSRARSNRDRITTSAGGAVGNWRFFAVTYDGTLAVNNVRFYFGSAAANAVLDVTSSYPAGPVGPNVGPLTIGHVNVGARAGSLDRMFRGLVDEVRIFGTVLTATEIVSVQRGTAALPRLIPGGLPVDGLTLSVDSGLARLAWPSELGQAYRVEFLDAIGGGEWQILTPEHPGDGSTVILEDAVKDQSQRFYRVFRLGAP